MARRKRSGNPRTLVLVIQDKSGSMSARRQETIDGFNEYISQLRRDGEGEILLTLTQFDTRVDRVYTNQPLPQVRHMSSSDYIIGGMTALYDAVGKTVHDIERIRRSDDRVIVAIMTDGGENSSREWRHEQILDLFKARRTDGWDFVFLGAGEEAWAAGQRLGFDNTNSISYGVADAMDHRVAFRSLATTTSNYSSGHTVMDSLAVDPDKAYLETKAGLQDNGNVGETPKSKRNKTKV